MRWPCRSSLLAILLSSANGAQLMSKVTAVSSAIQALDVVADDHVLTLEISLKLQSIDQLAERLQTVSSPDSPDYGKYIDAEDVRNMFNPSEESRNTVISWLKDSGITEFVDHGFHINFGANASTANAMLATKFQHFLVHGVSKIRTLEYSVPDEIAEHIDVISPTTFFGKTQAQAPVPEAKMLDEQESARLMARQRANTTLNCARLIEPGCLEKMYNYGGYSENASSGSRVGFGSFLNESALLEDLNLYQKAYNLPINNFSVVLINGGLDHQDPRSQEGEANLDSQFISAVVKTLPVVQFITAGKPPFVPSIGVPDEAHNTNEPYLEYYNYLLNKTNSQLPQVISNSYGDDEQSVPRDYATRICNMIGLMGLRGITILESSGDTGVGAACMSNDGKNNAEFTPQFPATCPYVTAVGGTQSYAPEVAWEASSGGFSNYFETAWYQTQTVKTYLDKHVTPETKAYYTKYTNFSGRAFPDISAHSLSPNYVYYFARRVGYTGGTSAAAPVVAGIIGLLNDARLRAGKPVMGFMNPWLYSTGYKALTDVTGGAAKGCNGINLQTGEAVPGGGIIPWASWNGTEGWDAATGLGMPDLQALVKLALV